MLLLMGYGWARPVPINPRNFRSARRDELLGSLAGPLSNLVLSLVFYLAYMLTAYRAPQASIALFSILSSAYYVNLMLFLFNLIPLPPLDGFHVLTCVFPRININALWKLRRYSTIILVVLMISGVLDYYLSWGANIVTGGFSRLAMLFI